MKILSCKINQGKKRNKSKNLITFGKIWRFTHRFGALVGRRFDF
jgi:hypothetical protein